MTVLVTGGSGSGKSLLAEQISFRLKQSPFYYLATMQIYDKESQARVARHRKQRAGKGFFTIEAPCHLTQIARTLTPGGTALLDCISNLTANEQFEVGAADPAQAVIDGVTAVQQRLSHLVVVTNEVFTDGVPQEPAMQAYLQYLGRINCVLAKQSDIVIEVCCGQPVLWKGAKQYAAIMA